MKPSFKHFLFASTLLVAFGSKVSASQPLVPGDISLIFYAETKNLVEPTTYVLNLGQGHLYRDKTGAEGWVANTNIGADLTTVFGEDWAERDGGDQGAVSWFIVGGRGATDPVANGDPSRTIYFSRSRSSFTAGATTPGSTIANINANNRGFLATNLVQYFTGTNDGINGVEGSTSISGSNPAGVILPTSNIRSPEDFVPPATLGVYFGQQINPTQRFLTGTVEGGAGVEGALDLYRILHTTAGAVLTAAGSSGNAVVGQGQYIGTLTIDGTGQLTMHIPDGSTPPTNNFNTWATTNNVTGGPTGDSDGDGISNLMEYALALNPSGPDATIGTFTGGTLSFTKRPEAVTNTDVTYAIEQSDDLGVTDPWEVVTPTTNTATAISYLLPVGQTKSFARLKVLTVTP